ncbi:type VI secretion system accessory protein TagJ [Acetobacter thailandicus]|uniref:type VI secretion system accessory protein TagJ n=1 Tax=Acetobacter thailandicus TaxID=1502842 RepID=UPI001BACA846|nr:type VI secretion system accessory protein TagJ [Acetobacter thailandicus]MBS0986206.1 tetratricopeptide repeat protein [Acetobacter thailandicus]
MTSDSISTTATEAFRSGNPEHAVELATAAVRATPTQSQARFRLFEMLLFSNQFERADNVLDALQKLDTKAALYIAECRQLLRAEVSRQSYWSSGQKPEFLQGCEPAQALCLRALTELHAQDNVAAATTLEEAENIRPHAPGETNKAEFSDFRDTDDLCAGALEVLTTTGRYFQVPFSRVESASFLPVKCHRDLYWRGCHLNITNGPDGIVYIPAIYGATATLAEHLPERGKLLTGQMTEWTDGDVTRGIGQRLFLAGDEGLTLYDIGELTFKI